MSDQKLFTQGKQVNIILSIFLISLIFITISKFLSTLGSILLTFTISFSLFLLKSAYLQAELLYYTLSFITFIFFLKTIKTSNKVNSLLSGFLAALAYLTKATMLLGFTIFIFFLLFKLTVSLKGNKTRLKNKKTQKTSFNRERGSFILPILSVLTFLAFTSPYLISNKKIYGQYFFNADTNIHMWCDSLTEFREMSKAGFDNPEVWKNSPNESKPGLINYLKKHSLTEVVKRLTLGFFSTLWLLTLTYAKIPALFSVYYTIFSIYLFFAEKSVRKKIKQLFGQNLPLLIFTICYLTIHYLAFSWYWFIGGGPRFILSLYIPYLFLVFLTIDKLDTNIKILPYILGILFLIVNLKLFIIPTMLEKYTGF